MTERERDEVYNRLEERLEKIKDALGEILYADGGETSIPAAVQEQLSGVHTDVGFALQDLWPLMGPVCDWCGHQMRGERGTTHRDCVQLRADCERAIAKDD